MSNTVVWLNSCCIERFHSCHSGAWMVPMSPSAAGALKCTPVGRAAAIWLKLSVMVNALADACHVAGAPVGSNGNTPDVLSALLILKETETGGLPSKLSTRPA